MSTWSHSQLSDSACIRHWASCWLGACFTVLSSVGVCAGHWKLGHTPKNFVLSQVVIFAQMCLFTFTRTAPGLFESFGFVDEQPVFISIVLFQLLQGPIDEARLFTVCISHAAGAFCMLTERWRSTRCLMGRQQTFFM